MQFIHAHAFIQPINLILLAEISVLYFVQYSDCTWANVLQLHSLQKC